MEIDGVQKKARDVRGYEEDDEDQAFKGGKKPEPI